MSLHGGALPRRRNSGGGTMKNFKIAVAVFLLLFLTGCSKEALVEKGVNLLDEMFTANLPGDPIPSGEDSPAAAPPAEPPDGSPAPEEPRVPEAVEPAVPDHAPPASEPPSAKAPVSTPEPPQADPSGSVTPSHTDATFFGPGESFKYLPKGTTGNYAWTYTSEDEAVAAVDSATGKVTAVGPGTTKVKMHVENNGQYDFECIVRCNWKDEEPEPALPDEPVQDAPGGIAPSHTDITFFNPKEHIKFLPVGAGDDIVCTYTTGNAQVASVDAQGLVTAVGPGTTSVTMTLDAGGTEYQFECIVRCSWS